MVRYNYRVERYEVRCLDTDATLGRRRTFGAACELRDLILYGERYIAFPDPYDWAIDGFE